MGERGDDRLSAWVQQHPREAAAAVGVLVVAGFIQHAGVPPLGALAVATIGAVGVVVWRRRGRPQRRGHLEVIDGCRWPLPWRWADWRWHREVERETARLVATWPEIAKLSGIPGARLRMVVADPDDGYEVRIEAYGRLATDVKTPLFHSAAGIPVEWSVQTPDLLRPWEFVIREAPQPVADGRHDELHDPAPMPAPVNLPDQRLEAILRALEAHGPASGRRLAKATGLDKTLVSGALLPELARRRQARRGEDGKWTLDPAMRRNQPAEETA